MHMVLVALQLQVNVGGRLAKIIFDDISYSETGYKLKISRITSDINEIDITGLCIGEKGDFYIQLKNQP